MRKTVRHLADGREILYFDDVPGAAPRETVDQRDMPSVVAESQIRRDPLTDEPVVLAAHRQTRTYKPPADLCPLCPSTPDRPTEVPEPDYEVVVFENRFPSLTADAGAAASTVDGAGIVPTFGGRGRCEVVCFTSDHRRSFAELTPQRVRTVVDVWADRTATLSSVEGVEQVFPFENRGEEIGVTLSHPHGQIYAYPFRTPRTERMLATADRYRARHGRHVLGDVLAAEHETAGRIVTRGQHWTAFVPPAARWPVQVQVVPHRQVADLTELRSAERDDFARVYLDVLRRCDALYDRPLPYVAGWYQAPVHSDRALSWLHLELFSIRRAHDKLKYLAGSESGMAVWVNDVTPEYIAERLREAG